MAAVSRLWPVCLLGHNGAMSDSSPSDSRLPPGILPPIPDGCGILPVAENYIHRGPHPELLGVVPQEVSATKTCDTSAARNSTARDSMTPDTMSCDSMTCDSMEQSYRRVLARALALCSGALLLTAVISATMVHSSALEQNIFAGPVAAKAVFLTQLLFLAFCGRFVEKLGMIPAAVLLFAYAAFCGLEFSALLPPAALAAAFLCAGLMYAFTAVWGLVRGCDLARPVTPIFMILGGGLILVAVNLALGTPRLAWTLSSIAVAVFAALAGSHAQQIRDFYQDFDDDNAEGWKASLVGALLLLLNSVNLYLLVAGIVVEVAAFLSGDDEKDALRDDLPN
jgi:FtsH-binding integral membrane protein